jgi:hypothetical protein
VCVCVSLSLSLCASLSVCFFLFDVVLLLFPLLLFLLNSWSIQLETGTLVRVLREVVDVVVLRFSFMQEKVLRSLVGRQRLAFSRAKRRDSDRETEREELELRML